MYHVLNVPCNNTNTWSQTREFPILGYQNIQTRTNCTRPFIRRESYSAVGCIQGYDIGLVTPFINYSHAHYEEYQHAVGSGERIHFKNCFCTITEQFTVKLN